MWRRMLAWTSCSENSGLQVTEREKPFPNLLFRLCCVPTQASLPCVMIAIFVASVSHSSMLCVVITKLLPSRASLMMSQISRRASGSSPLEGSSKRTSLGSPQRAMAMESLRCIPPDNDFAVLFSCSCRPTASAISFTMMCSVWPFFSFFMRM
mmetsp:Transcript_3450/g.12129  ORF Transcript_3450/g.12129 Transcript_3450/m.12129 type:complete len:153 (+) Transcript_3450:277-735(+)